MLDFSCSSRAQKTVTVAALFAVPALALSACSPNEPVATQPGTTPSIWTGSPSPAAPAEGGGEAEPAGEKLTAQLKLANGTTVATADFDFTGGYATVTVKTTTPGQLTPGFHGLHIHAVGKCEANSVAPTGGPPGDFDSAGAHFQVPGHSGHPASGDLTSLQVREDGTAELVTTTDAFTAEELTGRRQDVDHHPREGRQLRQHSAGALPADQRRSATRPDHVGHRRRRKAGRVRCYRHRLAVGSISPGRPGRPLVSSGSSPSSTPRPAT